LGTYALQGRIEVARVTQIDKPRIKLQSSNTVSQLELPSNVLESVWHDGSAGFGIFVRLCIKNLLHRRKRGTYRYSR